MNALVGFNGAIRPLHGGLARPAGKCKRNMDLLRAFGYTIWIWLPAHQDWPEAKAFLDLHDIPYDSVRYENEPLIESPDVIFDSRNGGWGGWGYAMVYTIEEHRVKYNELIRDEMRLEKHPVVQTIACPVVQPVMVEEPCDT